MRGEVPGSDLDFWGKVLATGGEGMIYVDAGGRIMAANAPAAAILGLAGQDLKGRRLTEVFPETRLAEVFTGGKPLMDTLFATGGKNYRLDYIPDGHGGVALFFKAGEPDAAQLQTINALYASLLDDFPLYLVVVNRQG